MRASSSISDLKNNNLVLIKDTGAFNELLQHVATALTTERAREMSLHER
jgi:hypothetical protein